MLAVASLHIYPVKSCGSVPVRQMTLDGRGPVDDRRFMIVDDDGRFLTQREEPTLALVSPTLVEGGVLLDAPSLETLEVRADGGRRAVQVWSSELEAIDMGDEVAGWLSNHLSRTVRMVRMAPDVIRPVDAPYGNGETSVAFADGFPLLVTHTASLDELNERLEQPVIMERFRPNLVVTGGEPWAEDGWRTLRVGDLRISLVKPCKRCIVINVATETGETSKEPLRTLATYRCVTQGEVIFGQNAVHEGPGTLEVGDEVRVS
jgi:uncharacterized protein YcbX